RRPAGPGRPRRAQARSQDQVAHAGATMGGGAPDGAPWAPAEDRTMARSTTKLDQAQALRDLLRRQLAWEDAHAGFERAVQGLAADLRGRVPEGLPYSAWQLVEHLRRAQHDILDFCKNPRYKPLEFP